MQASLFYCGSVEYRRDVSRLAGSLRLRQHFRGTTMVEPLVFSPSPTTERSSAPGITGSSAVGDASSNVTTTDQSWRDCRLDVLATAIVTAVAIAIAAAMFVAYYRHPEELWRNLWHDRSAHYGFGLDVASALRTLNPIEFLAALEGVRLWAPLHPVLLSVVLAVGGLDHRLAVLPSLAGWVMTVVLAWLIARRLFADQLQGIVAGTVAALFVIASPLFRALASDVMLETVGAALTALVIWLYLRAAETPHDYARWRALAFALTLLFLEKQNYWLLTAAAFALAVLSESPRACFARMRRFVVATRVSDLIRNSFRDPLLVALAVVCAVIVAILIKGPTVIHVFDRQVSLYPPGNLITVAWALLFVRIIIFRYQNQAVFDEQLGLMGRAIFYWHVIPIGCFLLLPHRLQFFLFFVSPANSLETQSFDPWSGAQFYGRALIEDFHAADWSAGLALVLALLAFTQMRRLAPGARIVHILLVLSAAAVVIHPNTEGRYLASWIFALWTLSGAGAAILVHWLTARLSETPRMLAAAGLISILVVLHVPASQSRPAVPLVGVAAGPASDLDLAAAYLPAIAGLKRVGFVLSFGHNPFISWSVRQQCECRAVIDMPNPMLPASREQVRQAVQAWANVTPAQRIVAIDTFDRNNQPNRGWGKEQARGMMDGMAGQHRFERIQTISLPTYPAEITIWAPRASTSAR
jgi:Dolichyl-phosphate-mannose-protein mannosyltransferase